MNEVRQSEEFARYMEGIGWQTQEIKTSSFAKASKDKQNSILRIYLRNIPLLGLFAKIPRPEQPINSSLTDAINKTYHPFAVRIDYSPTKTLVLNLNKPLEKILEEFDKDTRYEIRKAEKNSVLVEESQDIETFISMWHQNAKKRGFWIPFGKELRTLAQAFGSKGLLLLAKQNGRPVSGAVILFSGKTAAYFSAASTPQGRQVSSPYLVLWRAIQIAKKRGCKIFDFEGLKDPRDSNTKNWGGFTQFKKGFGGNEIDYPLSETYFLNPVINVLVQVTRRLHLS